MPRRHHRVSRRPDALCQSRCDHGRARRALTVQGCPLLARSGREARPIPRRRRSWETHGLRPAPPVRWSDISARSMRFAAAAQGRSWPFSVAPVVRLRVRYGRSCCCASYVVGETLHDPKRTNRTAAAVRSAAVATSSRVPYKKKDVRTQSDFEMGARGS